MKKLPVTLEEITFKAKFDEFITEKNKREIMSRQKSNHENIFSSCDGILLYGECVVIPVSLKKNIEGFSYRTSRNH